MFVDNLKISGLFFSMIEMQTSLVENQILQKSHTLCFHWKGRL